jgi:hypothetical protein
VRRKEEVVKHVVRPQQTWAQHTRTLTHPYITSHTHSRINTQTQIHRCIHTYRNIHTRTHYTSEWGARKRGSSTKTGTWYAHNTHTHSRINTHSSWTHIRTIHYHKLLTHTHTHTHTHTYTHARYILAQEGSRTRTRTIPIHRKHIDNWSGTRWQHNTRHIYTHIHNAHACMHALTHPYTHTHAHIHTHTHKRARAHTHTHARKCDTQLSSRRIEYLDTHHTNT